MTAPFKTWKVLPQGKLTEVDENILTVVGEIRMPIGDLPRRMTVVRLADGRLVIFSAIALDEDEMLALETYGTPAFLIVPSDRHRLDARIWKYRYPNAQVITPEGARSKVESEVPVDATTADFGDPEVRLIDVPGTRAHEAALEITGAKGSTLVVNDIIGNIRGEQGFGGWLLRLMNFAGDEPHIPGPIQAAIVRDKAELGAQLLRWADLPGLKRILVSHGSIIDEDAPGVLRKLAASLD
ncbi:MAG: hypothetical protein ABIO37_06920 [Caulobacteraceae bacterium]